MKAKDSEYFDFQNRALILEIHMSKNPFVNGVAASAYIMLVAWVMTVVSKMAPVPNTFLAPVAFLSMFTLSAAIMAYIFCYQPIQLYFDGKKKLAINLFMQTIAVFAGITLIIFVVMLSGILPAAPAVID